MNFADSIQSQDNINKVVSQEKEYNSLPMERMTDISVADKINKLPDEKTRSKFR